MYLQIAIALRATAQSTHAVRDSFIQQHIAPHCNILGAGTHLQIAIALRATAQSARTIRDSFIRQHTAPHYIPLQHTWRGYASPHPHCTTLRHTPTHLARAHFSRLRSPSKYTHAHAPLHTHIHIHTHPHTELVTGTYDTESVTSFLGWLQPYLSTNLSRNHLGGCSPIFPPKRPPLHTGALYVHKRVLSLCKKSPISENKSPVSPHRSPISPQKIHI